MSDKINYLTIGNSLAFFKKCRVCEEGSGEVSEVENYKKCPPSPMRQCDREIPICLRKANKYP